ncbi:uncharacterized protein LOC114258179 isoform X1 [Camellia sinensis]|uniref:uncharacterized protein LOC114258179 isoform X1 n=1 Tax=Camellia sinensis TaxID=4442 RepID=UPI001035D47F|nr:uncharacterized protein LOC114258179 isoform X1 [Camellia sinensis]
MAWRRFATLLRQRTDDINDGARKIVSLGVGGCIGCLFCDWFYEIHGMQPSKERSQGPKVCLGGPAPPLSILNLQIGLGAMLNLWIPLDEYANHAINVDLWHSK